MSPAWSRRDEPVRNRLGAVKNGQRADRLGTADDLGHRVDGAENVALVDESNDLGALVDEAFGISGFEIEPAVVGEANHRRVAPEALTRSCHGTRLE